MFKPVRCFFLTVVFLAVAMSPGAQGQVSSLRVIVAGDLMGHIPIHNAFRQADGSYDYAPCFQYVEDYVKSADVAIVNLEVTLAGEPYSGFPYFSAPDAYAAAAHNAGFGIMTTANNHSMDKGRRGLERTIDVLDSLGVGHLGTYKDAADRARQHPLIVDRGGIRLALLNYTYGTNGISVREPNVVNLLDTSQIRHDIKKARLMRADFIMALVHWGVEYQHQHNGPQETMARWLFANGCDVVVGSHPHVVQDITVDGTDPANPYHNLVVYSLGNFVSNQRTTGEDGGIMIELELWKAQGVTTIHHAAYFPFWVDRPIVGGRRRYRLVPVADAVQYPVAYGLSPGSQAAMRKYHDHVTAVVKPTPSHPQPENKPDARQQWGFSLVRESRFYYDGEPLSPWLWHVMDGNSYRGR